MLMLEFINVPDFDDPEIRKSPVNFDRAVITYLTKRWQFDRKCMQYTLSRDFPQLSCSVVTYATRLHLENT